MAQKIRLQSTFIWRIKDGSVKSNDIGAVVEVYMLLRDKFGTETIVNITLQCNIVEAIVDDASGLHTLEVVHTIDTDVIKPYKYIINCRDSSDDQHVFLSVKVYNNINWRQHQVDLYPAVQ